MNKNSLVSIIIPVYNEEKYLGYCLQSLKEQTYKHTEIIVVDDGSTDSSIKIAKKYKSRIFSQKHQGPGVARNYGARKAKGEIFAFLDADMKYDQQFVEKLIEPILEKRVIGTMHKDELIANPENIWADCWRINSDLPQNRHAPENLPDISSAFRAILKDKFIEAGGFDPEKGYFDDSTIAEKLHTSAVCIHGPKAYHFNPETLEEVYYSSRWIGRGMKHTKSFTVFLRYTLFNSLRNALRKIIKGAPLQYIIFKIVYDAGIFNGIFFSKSVEK